MDYGNMLRGNGFLCVNKVMLRVLGLDKAVFLGHFFDIQSYRQTQKQLTPDGSFYITAADWRENTGQSRHTLNKSIHWAEALGIIQTNIRGIPAKRYFKVIDAKMTQFINDLFSTEKASEILDPETDDEPTEIDSMVLDQKPAEIPQSPITEGLLGICTPTVSKPVSVVEQQSLQHPVKERSNKARMSLIGTMSKEDRDSLNGAVEGIIEWYKDEGKTDDQTRSRGQQRIRDRLVDGWRPDVLFLALTRYVWSTDQHFREQQGVENDESCCADRKYFYGIGNFFGNDSHFLQYLDETVNWRERTHTPSAYQSMQVAQHYRALKQQYREKYGADGDRWHRELHKRKPWEQLWQENVSGFKLTYPDTWQKEIYGDWPIPEDLSLCPGGKTYSRDYDEKNETCINCPQNDVCSYSATYDLMPMEYVVDQMASKRLH